MKIILIDSVLFEDMPWWCRGYHVGLSSPRLGFKSRPGRFNILVVFVHIGL